MSNDAFWWGVIVGYLMGAIGAAISFWRREDDFEAIPQFFKELWIRTKNQWEWYRKIPHDIRAMQFGMTGHILTFRWDDVALLTSYVMYRVRKENEIPPNQELYVNIQTVKGTNFGRLHWAVMDETELYNVE